MTEEYQILYIDTDGVDLGLSSDTEDNNGDVIKEKIKELNKKWQNILGFKDFELDMEEEDFMFPIKHKNYLYGSLSKGESGIKTKGNNFDAKNKPDIAVEFMKKVVYQTLINIGNWQLKDSETVRQKVKQGILDNMEELLKEFEGTQDRDKLIMYENVSPASTYKKDDSIYVTRTRALEKLLNRPITSTNRIAMIVCKEPLPIEGGKLSNKGTKAIHFMYPEELVTQDMIDMDWYISNIRDYILGAFGLNKVTKKTQNTTFKSKVKTVKLSKDQESMEDWF